MNRLFWSIAFSFWRNRGALTMEEVEVKVAVIKLRDELLKISQELLVHFCVLFILFLCPFAFCFKSIQYCSVVSSPLKLHLKSFRDSLELSLAVQLMCSSRKYSYHPHAEHFCFRAPHPLEFPFQGMPVTPSATILWNFCDFPASLGNPWKEHFHQKCCCTNYYVKDNCFSLW